MIVRLSVFACLLAFVAPVSYAWADLRADVMRCAAIENDTARLACYDAIAVPATGESKATLSDSDRRVLENALQREFRFDPGLRIGPHSFRIAVSGDLQISRATAAAREVERLVRRIARAFGDFNNWGVTVTVHGAQVAFSRGNPYSGAELAQQANAGLARTGLTSGRYTVETGEPAQPRLWDDGRIRDANEHIDVVITGLD